MRKSTVVLAGLFVVAFIGGCLVVRRRAPSPADRVQAFIEAGQRGDDEAGRRVLTAKSRENAHLTRSAEADAVKHAYAEYRIGPTTMSGNTASLAVAMKDAQSGDQLCHVKLRREGGEWSIYAIAVPLPGSSTEITFDFERPETMAAALGMAMGQGLHALGEGFATGLSGR